MTGPKQNFCKQLLLREEELAKINENPSAYIKTNNAVHENEIQIKMILLSVKILNKNKIQAESLIWVSAF